MSTWIETWVSAGSISVAGFGSPLNTIVNQAFFAPQSTFQQYIAPFLTFLLCTPGGRLFPMACDAIFRGVWFMLPFDFQAQFWWGGILRPLPSLSFAAGMFLEQTFSADMRWGDRIQRIFWTFSVPLGLFILTIALLNGLVVFAADVICSLLIYLPVMLVGKIPEFSNTSRVIQGLLSFIRVSFYLLVWLLVLAAFVVPLTMSEVAHELLVAARESEHYYIRRH
ncbi:hypothetical protein CC79DRAFT_1370301 [Sarocladium strictum]